MKKLLFILLLLVLGCVDDKPVIDVNEFGEDEAAELFLSESFGEGTLIEYLAIHCTASREGLDLDAQWFLNFFKNERKWSRPGYSFLIELDGTIVPLWENDLDPFMTQGEITNGVYGYNRRTISISYVGGVDKYLRAKDTRTPEQKQSIDKLVQMITCRIPDLIILGHKDFDGVTKACPSFDVEKEYGYMNPTLNTSDLFDHSD